MDNPKKKKLDSKRFAISQKHERDYMIKSAKRLLKLFEKDMKLNQYKPFIQLFTEEHKGKTSIDDRGNVIKNIGTKPIMRCFKVLISILENYNKKKRKR